MNITLADIADYRKQLNSIEQLIVNRDHIQAQILEIDNVLQGYTGGDTLTLKSRRYSGDALAPRLQAACSKFPEGITLAQLTEELGVASSTASAYVYSRRVGAKFLHRDYTANGKPIWFFDDNPKHD